MIKKIKISDLVPGMYVHDLNCGWLEHPFIRNRFLIKTEQEVQKIIQFGIRELYIDTNRGFDVPEAPTLQAVHQHLENRMHEISSAKQGAPKEISVEDELPRAKKIYREAHQLVQTMLLDVRMGQQVALEKMLPVVSTITDSILRNPDAMLSLLRIKQADHYTFQHSIAVSTLLAAFCSYLKLKRPIIEQVGIGGLLHDIGKMKVSLDILNKPGKLTEQEFDLMKKHVEFGRSILESTPGIFPISIDIIAQHHERHDGSGYPLRLRGAEISHYGQMASIADV